MIEVKSYDVFDTLLARRYFFPGTVFEEVQRISGFSDFYHLRRKAENESKIKTLDGFYRTFSGYSSKCASASEELKKLEIELEFQHTYPIVPMTQLVTENDIIISDFYFKKEDLGLLLRSHGIHYRELYTSYDGKSGRRVWPKVQRKYKILKHYGDNKNSDIASANEFKIPSHHVTISDLNDPENFLASMGIGKVACMGRAVRLSNPYHSSSTLIEKNIWDEQAKFNIPILIILSQYLHNKLVDGQVKKLLFTQRDCCNLFDIYTAMYPTDNAHKFYTNRKLYYNPTDTFISYVKNMYTQESLIVDLQGTGDSCYGFFSGLGINPNYFTLVDSDRDNKQRDTKDSMVSYTSGISDKIERLNYDINGRLKDVVTNSPVFEPPTRHVDFIKVQHEAVGCAIKFIKGGFRFDYEPTVVRESIKTLLLNVEENPAITRVVPHEEI